MMNNVMKFLPVAGVLFGTMLFTLVAVSPVQASDSGDWGDLGGGYGGYYEDSFDLGGGYGGYYEDSFDLGGGYGNYDQGSYDLGGGYGGYYEDSFDLGSGYGDYYNDGSYTPYDSGYYEEDSFYPYDSGYDSGNGYYEEDDFYPYESDYGYYEEDDFYPYDSGSDYTDYYEDIYDVGSSYGGGYSYGGGSFGGGYALGGGYPTTIYSPKYTTPVIPPTVITKPSKTVTTPSSNTIVNNNTNNNSNVNINNNTAVAVAQVQIGSQQATQPQYPTYPAPYCTISYTQYTAYNYGTKQVYLSWTSSNASSAYLSGYGSVAVNGSQTVYAAASQTYTLTVYGYNGQQATCQTTVYGTTYTPTPYVSLTQIPYTGFDFGPIGNAAYWAGLVSVALAGAYLAVYYIPSLVFAGTATRAYAPVVAPKAPILVEREAALEAVNPIVATFRKAGTNDAMAIVKSNDGSMPKIVIERY